MKQILSLILIVPLLLVSGCGSPNASVMSHTAFRAAVTLGEQIALDVHPEATPYVRAATPVVCGVANSSNISPAAIVAALDAAGVTNKTTRDLVNGSLAILNVIVASIGTNQTELRLYGQDLCAGMTDGLPPVNAVARAMSQPLPVHLK